MKLVVKNRAGIEQTILYDTTDQDLVSRYRWRAEVHPHTCYAATTVVKDDGTRTTLYMHRLLMNEQVDHVNRNGLDNRRANLRPATHLQNCGNRGRQANNRTSRFKGVTWHSRGGKWQAQIAVNGRRRYLGLFENETAAALAYDAAALEAWGEFALLNNPLGES